MMSENDASPRNLWNAIVQNAGSRSRFDDLYAALQSGGPDTHVAMLRQVTDPVLSEANHLNEAQIGVFGSLLVQVVESLETTTLLEISQRLALVARALIDPVLNRARYPAASFSEDSLAVSLRGREASAGVPDRAFQFSDIGLHG
jgi:hypothetical protein